MPNNQKIYIIHGSDDGACSEDAHKLFNQIKPQDSDDFANDIIDGNADNAEHAYDICQQTLQALQTLPFFGGQKVVWLKRATFMGSDKTSEAERAKSGVDALLKQLTDGLSDDVIFILSATAIDKRKSFYKWVKNNAQIIEHNKLDTTKDGWQEQIAKTVQTRSKALNLEFTTAALELFVILAGEDTRQLTIEIEKIDLALGTKRRTVEIDDVRAMVPLSRTGIIFEIGRALQKREGVRALQLIDQQLNRGESAIAILRASLIPTIRNLFMAKSVVENHTIPVHNYNIFSNTLNRLPESDTTWLPQKKAGGVNTYPLFLAAKDAESFSLYSLKNALSSCLNADHSLVTSGLNHRLVLHRLVVELIGSARHTGK